MTNLNDAENDIDYFNLGLVVDSIPAEGIEGMGGIDWMEGIDGMEGINGINGMDGIDGMEGIEGDLLDYNEIDNKADQGEPETEYWNPKGFTEFKTCIDFAFRINKTCSMQFMQFIQFMQFMQFMQ